MVKNNNNRDLSRYSSQETVKKELKKLEKELFNPNHQWNKAPLTVSPKEIEEIESLEQAVTIYGRLQYISKQQKTGPSKLFTYSALGIVTAYTLGVMWLTTYLNPSQYVNNIDTTPYKEFITKSSELIIPKKSKEELLLEETQQVLEASDAYYKKFKQLEQEEKARAKEVHHIPSRLRKARKRIDNNNYKQALNDLKQLLGDIKAYSQEDEDLILQPYIDSTKNSILHSLEKINQQMRYDGASVDKVHKNYLEQQHYASPYAQINIYVKMYDYHIKNLALSEEKKNTALYKRSLYYLKQTASMIKNNKNHDLQKIYTNISETIATKPEILPNHSPSPHAPSRPEEEEEDFDIDVQEPEAVNMDEENWDDNE